MSAVRRWAVEGGRTDLVRPAAATSPVEVTTRRGSVRFDAARAAFVVVDMQNDFCHPGGWLASIGVDVSAARAAIGPINRLSPLLRGAGVPVLWLDWGTRADRVNLPPNGINVYDPEGVGAGIGAAHAGSPAVLEEGSWGAALVDELDVRDDDIRVSKHRMSGVWDTPLDSILRTLGIDTVLFAGVNLDQCVYATLIDAACLGYDCILVEQASATTSPDFCVDATVYNVDQCFGFCVAAADLELALTTEGHH
ncbi:cysteine hydrolase [Humibacter sp. BT305]|nr:cysteine hydrolase [Humibacter sp. BT305]